MEVKKTDLDNGLHVVITASMEDMIEADLMPSFTRNQLFPSGFQLIQSGRVINYLNNMVVKSALDDGEMILLAAAPPQYRIFGESKKFAEFHLFYPRAGKGVIKSGSEDFEPDYKTPFGNKLQQPDGWDHTTMKSDKK